MTASYSRRPEIRDVIVIGGGPAGAMTAQRLAEQGHDVVLLEEHATIGSPVHCTGLMGAEAFDEFDLPRDTILGEATAARFWGAAGQSVEVKSDRIQAVVIDRAKFDRRLVNLAACHGAEVRRGWRAESVVVDSAFVRVICRDEPEAILARSCVLACGANYRFHRALGLGLPDTFLQSAQLETPFPAMPEIEVRFGREVAPAGFAWLVPIRRDDVPHARIGLMTATKSRSRFAGFVEHMCARVGIDASTLPPPRLKMLPLGPVPRTFADRVIAVGDAAGLVKPTTGGGIHYGLLSGVLGAEVLNDALRRDSLKASFLRRYERRWRQRLGQEIRVGLAFRKIAAQLTDETIDSLIELARVNGVIPLLQEKASFNWHRKAAIALLAHRSFRQIVFRSLAWRNGGL